MNVRLANKFDLPYILDMLRNFREQTPIEEMRNCNNEEYINKVFHHIILGGGVALVAEEEQPMGMIMGIKDQSIWDPDIKILRELVYWVEPEARGSSAGYRLIKEYNKRAEEMRKDNQIKMYTMTKMVNSPDLDFSRFGYQKTEEVWVAGV